MSRQIPRFLEQVCIALSIPIAHWPITLLALILTALAIGFVLS